MPASFGRTLTCELKRAFESPWMMVSLAVSCALVAVSAWGNFRLYSTVAGFVRDYGAEKAYGIESLSAFSLWAVVDPRQPTTHILYALMPLACCVPWSWSLGEDLRNGFSAQELTRTGSRGEWLAAKYCSCFLSGALAAGVPVGSSVVLSLCIAPATLPTPTSLFYLEAIVDSQTPLAFLYYNAPALFAFCWTCIDMLLAGLWATCVMAVSCLVRSRIALLAGAELTQLLVRFLTTRLSGVLGTEIPSFDLPTLMYLGAAGPQATPIAILVVASLMAGVSALAFRLLGRGDLSWV